MTVYRTTVLDTPQDPFRGGTLRSELDAGLRVEDGHVVERGAFEQVRAHAPMQEVVDLRDGIVLPGLIDTHVHFPQVRIIGALGLPLLDWLDRCALPEEERLAEASYSAAVAGEFVHCLTRAGTTSALVFGSHFPAAMDAFFAAAQRTGLHVTSGLVVSDRNLPEPLRTTPEQAYEQTLALARCWPSDDRRRYAVTPRFSYSCSPQLLAACGSAMRELPDAWCTSHVNENPTEIDAVAAQFADLSYAGSYDRFGLLGPRTVLAHNVHPGDAELELLAARRTAIAHCPTSNCALGSGMFPMRRHLDHGVRFALGTDVGAGTGFSLIKEGLQADFVQRLLGPVTGLPLTAAQLLYLATAAGADALGLADHRGHLGVGARFDAVHVAPPPGSALAVGMRHANGPEEALARVFAMGAPSDLRGVWIGGRLVHGTAGTGARPGAQAGVAAPRR